MVGTIGRFIILTAVMAAALSLYAEEEWTEASVKALSNEEYAQKQNKLSYEASKRFQAIMAFSKEAWAGTTKEDRTIRTAEDAGRALERLQKLHELDKAYKQARLESLVFAQLRESTKQREEQVASWRDYIKKSDQSSAWTIELLERLKKKKPAAESQ